MLKVAKIFCVLCLSLLLFPKFVFADSQPSVSLSDAIIADLALRNYLDYVSIYFVDKQSPNTVSINSTKQWLPASTVKLFVAMYAYDQIAKKHISLTDWVTIDDKNVVPTELETPEYPVLTSGLITTVDTLIQKMITQSDNTSYNTLLDLFDRKNITEYVQSLGLTHTIVGSKLNLDDNQTQYEFTTPGYNINTTTAADYAKAYEIIDNNKLPGSQQLQQILSHQKINSMLPAYLPSNLTIEHKTGDLDPLYHDGGIVIGNNQHYILSMFSNLGNPNILAHISELIYTRNYALVGSTIPEKDDSSIPDSPQALDPLVMNPSLQTVLGATTPINVPLPNITAADLGISQKDLSLVIQPKDLPKTTLPPVINTIWFGVQKAVVIGEKARQQVSLSYAKTELARAYQLTKQGKTQEATQTLQTVSDVVRQVAKDSVLPPDQSTQLTIKAISDTRFSVLHDQFTSAKNDSQRAQLITTIANQARTQLVDVEPHLADAKTAANLAQQPIVGKIIDTAPDHIVVQTSGGQQVTIPVDQNLKVKDQSHVTATPTPVSATSAQGQNTPASSPSLSPTISEAISPTLSPSGAIEDIQSGVTSRFKKGASIAILGNTKGSVITPSLIVNNIPQEIAAPHPVVAVKVNTKDNTMVVSDNGNFVQVDLTPKTAIKAKDTNVELQSIKPGSVLVVHGNLVEPVKSDSSAPVQSQTTPTGIPQLTKGSLNPSSLVVPTNQNTPVSVTTSQQTPATITSSVPVPSGVSQPLITGVKATPTGKPNLLQPGGVSPQVSPGRNLLPSPTAIPSATIQPIAKPTTATPPQPEVIRATSIQVIQQQITSPKPAKQAAPQPAQTKPNPPAQQQSQSKPAQTQPNTQNGSSQKGKSSGK